jgi:hypothetical protein
MISPPIEISFLSVSTTPGWRCHIGTDESNVLAQGLCFRIFTIFLDRKLNMIIK